MKTFEQFCEASAQKFKVGDKVAIKQHSPSGVSFHGISHIDSASDIYARASHPDIEGLKIKVHQKNGKESVHGYDKPHYTFHHASESVTEDS